MNQQQQINPEVIFASLKTFKKVQRIPQPKDPRSAGTPRFVKIIFESFKKEIQNSTGEPEGV